jgi:ABC-type transport system involved in multi-copper enzyme maturation permease subunit
MRLDLNPKTIFTIAKKEYMDNLRNKWILALTIIFIILTLVMSFVHGGGELTGVEVTVLGLISISTLLVPIIAIMLGYAAISGEAETGSLSVVLAHPVKRFDVLIGKYIGLGSVLSTSILLGFGIAGIVIMTSDAGELGGYLVFICLTILLGLVYLSLSMCFSAILKRRVTSLGAGIGLFFWAMIIGTVIMAIFMAQGGDIMDIGTTGMPDWMWSSMMILSPSDMYQTATMLGFGLRDLGVMGFEISVPAYITMGKLLVIFATWILAPLFIAYYFFRKRDI